MIVPTSVALRGEAAQSLRCAAAPRRRPGAWWRMGLLIAAAGHADAALAGWVGEAIDLMGTRVSVELWHEDEARGRELVEAVLEDYRRIDRSMSTYKSDSAISQVNAAAASRPVPVDAELFSVVERSLEISRISGGAFDITYESVGYLYDFRAKQHPTEPQIADRLGAVDFRHVQLDRAARTIRFAAPGVRINLGGIAKGYAVEHAAEWLRARGVEHALLNAGGDTRVIGDRRGAPWIVGIRHPRLEGEVFTRLPIVDEAISTSGDYERFFEEDGRRYHHIINPSTGQPVDGMLSVTVIGPNATNTDALSTTLFVLGAEQGLELIETLPEYQAVFVAADGTFTYSSGLAPP